VKLSTASVWRSTGAALRIRAAGAEADDELVTGDDLAPNLAEALRATLG